MPEPTSPKSASLSRQLARTAPEGFFSPLSSPLSAVYIDCADRLEIEAGEAARLDLQEARQLVLDVVSTHPDFRWPEDLVGVDVRVRAGKILNHLLEVRWLEDRTESLNERWVILSPALRPVLHMLRELAADSIHELHSFAETLAGICQTLEAPGVLTAEQSADILRSTISDLNRRLGYAITQLHSVEKIVHGFEQRQMRTQSGAETLQLFYEEFHSGQHMVCHEVLHRRGLLNRIHSVRDSVRAAAADPAVKDKLAAAMSSDNGWQQASDEFTRLIRGLTGIRQRADAVDERIASFHQLSRQRFFYQSQMRGRRPEMARELCASINKRFAGERFNNLDEYAFREVTAPWKGLLAVEVEILHGTAALRMPRRVRLPVSLSLSDASLGDPDAAELERLRGQMRVAVTPARAARLIKRHLSGPGEAISTQELVICDDESLLDLLATASFDHASLPEGILRWQIALSHSSDAWDRKFVPVDSVGTWTVERFTLTRTK
jgi:hypothetical protein